MAVVGGTLPLQTEEGRAYFSKKKLALEIRREGEAREVGEKE